jgi:hypothetical protein
MEKNKAVIDERHENNFLENSTRSPEKAYYEFMLRKEKLSAITRDAPWLDADEKKALNEISDKEKLELKVLARLYRLADSSADYLQVKTITGCDTREEIAAKLADIYYKKYITDDIMNRFVAPSTTKREILLESAKKSRAAFDAFGNA